MENKSAFEELKEELNRTQVISDSFKHHILAIVDRIMREVYEKSIHDGLHRKTEPL